MSDLEAPTQYATVWNNGLPGFLIDRYKPNGESHLPILQRILNIIIVIALIMMKANLCININNCAI